MERAGDTFFEITTRRIGIQPVIEKVLDAESGALVVFIGTVRRLSRGREIKQLEYEAYEEMALREFGKIAEDVKEDWNVRRVAIIHRTGRLKLGQISVVIAVSAAHREDAYGASRQIIERLKQVAPIWKKEVWEGGEEWLLGS